MAQKLCIFLFIFGLLFWILYMGILAEIEKSQNKNLTSEEIKQLFPDDDNKLQLDVDTKIQLLESEIININGSNDKYFKEYKIHSGFTQKINLFINKTNNFGYLTFQLHSFAFNLQLSTDINFSKKSVQNGQNIGIIMFKNETIYIKNTLSNDINYAIAIISYDLNTPVVGGCNLEDNISELPNLIVKTVKTNNDMIQVDTPLSAMSIKMDPEQKLCSKLFNNSILKYDSVYRFLPKHDFTKETYFLYIENFLLPKNITNIGSLASKKNMKGPANRRIYLKTPGVGMIFNTIVHDLNGISAAYVPTITYFCNPFIWEDGCNFIFDDVTLKFISWLVIISGFIKVIFPVGPLAMYCDLVINTFSIGAYYTFRVLLYLNMSPSIVIIIISAILLTILVVVLIALLGEFVLVLHVISMILFSGILALITVYQFNDDVSTSNAILYWGIFSLSLFVLMFSLFVIQARIIWLILNSCIAFWYIFYGLTFFVNSNLVYITLMHFYTIKNADYQYVNGRVSPSKTDIWILFGTIGIVLFSIIIKTNNICSRNRRNSSANENDEQRPLISRWTNGSDDVFESPNANRRLFQYLGLDQSQNEI